jgi:hypothetical protein
MTCSSGTVPSPAMNPRIRSGSITHDTFGGLARGVHTSAGGILSTSLSAAAAAARSSEVVENDPRNFPVAYSSTRGMKSSCSGSGASPSLRKVRIGMLRRRATANSSSVGASPVSEGAFFGVHLGHLSRRGVYDGEGFMEAVLPPTRRLAARAGRSLYGRDHQY